jgi:hypothetical protein
MSSARERRREVRIAVQLPATVQVLAEPPSRRQFDPSYERIAIPTELAGDRFEATICDLSVNGAMLAAKTVPPLLSRLSVSSNCHATAPRSPSSSSCGTGRRSSPPQMATVPDSASCSKRSTLTCATFIADMVERADLRM